MQLREQSKASFLSSAYNQNRRPIILGESSTLSLPFALEKADQSDGRGAGKDFDLKSHIGKMIIAFQLVFRGLT